MPNMRLVALFPALCAMIAMILSFLCVFAGTNHDMMESYDLLTLNTSRIGVEFLNNHTKHSHPLPSKNYSNHGGSVISSWFHNMTAEIHNATDKAIDKVEDELEDELEEDVNNVLRSLAKDLGIRDFYSVHVMDYCEGYFQPNGTANRNVTQCSNSTGMFSFNATQALQKELNHTKLNITLEDLHWPSAIDDGIKNLKLAFNATFVFYCIGIIFTGLAFLGSIAGVFLLGRLSAFFNLGLAWSAFFFLMLASAVVTSAATKATNLINKHGLPINVNAARGDKFISLTWAAVALMIVAGVAWLVDFFIGRRMQKKMPKQFIDS